MKKPSLDEVLDFDFPALKRRFSRDIKTDSIETDEVFTELKRWLWLLNEHAYESKQASITPKELSVFSHFLIIDEMWHQFILFTKEYANFCHEKFGYFIHHAPNVDEHEYSKDEYQADIAEFMNYAYEKIGEHTLTLWFDFFPARYCKDELARRRNSELL